LDPRLENERFTERFVIGCAGLQHEGVREITAYRQGKHLEELCVDTLFRHGSLGQCRDPSEPLHGLPEVWFFGPGDGRWIYFSGFVSTRVAKVRLRYRSLGKVRRPKATITRVTEPALLARLNVEEPLAYYSVEASRRARDLLILARNRQGKLISWRALPDLPDLLR
jgi:hypothetical protein